jgi:hypothetical protein
MYWIERGIDEIVLLQVEDTRIKQDELNILWNRIFSLIQYLASGRYKYFRASGLDEIINLEGQYSAVELGKIQTQYEHCLSDRVVWKTKRIGYASLKDFIFHLSKKRSVSVDVTSVDKGYIGDLIACALLAGLNGIFIFKLLDKPNFEKPWAMLYHNLDEGNNYRYINIIETQVFSECSRSILIRTTPLILSIAGTIMLLSVVLIASFVLGFDSGFMKVISAIGTVLGISSFWLIFLPVHGK